MRCVIITNAWTEFEIFPIPFVCINEGIVSLEFELYERNL